jgi:CheY-like chemotaxis protein
MSLVLVVDDDPDQRALFTELLEAMGHQVIDAPNGEVALELACQLEPDLVLTDWHMPRMDGLTLCQKLRQNARLCGTRVILHSSELVPQPCYADAWCMKQGDPGLIEDMVSALLPHEVRRWRGARRQGAGADEQLCQGADWAKAFEQASG